MNKDQSSFTESLAASNAFSLRHSLRLSSNILHFLLLDQSEGLINLSVESIFIGDK
jgi:hypothetical protein